METSSIERIRLGVGIDTARYGHHVTFLGPDRQPVAAAMRVAESGVGYRKLHWRLRTLQRKYPEGELHVHIDAAGQYATNLERFLRGIELPIQLSVGQPKQNKDYHQAIFPKRKADASESHAMARFAVVEQPPGTEAVPDAVYVLREIAGRLESQVKDATRATNRLHNLLARTFPELATITSNIAAAWVLQLLAKYPTPERILGARLASLARIPYVTQEKARRIREAARQTVGSLRGALAEQLVQQAIVSVQQSQRAVDQLERLLFQAYEDLPVSPHVHLDTIAGIGAVTAAVLVAKIVSIDRFATAEKLVGYFGVFPEERSSGVDRRGLAQVGKRRMSKKGNDLVRRYLFCAAKSAVRYNPAVRALYARLRARGTRGDVALGHCMRKLLHQVFTVWATDAPFDENKVLHKANANTADQHDVGLDSAAQEEAAGPKQESLPAKQEAGTDARRWSTADAMVDDVAGSVNRPNSPAQPVIADGQKTRSSRGVVDYAYLRGQITIEQVLRRLGHFDHLRGKNQLRGRCLLHQPARDASRSFSVNLRKNVFRCLDPQCAAHGNALDLWAAYHGLPLYDAALHLADTFHLAIRPDQRSGNP